MSDASAKQQIVDKIKESTNILVTVSNNPSVDELSAALGLSLLLNKMKKHATAVFSGEIPPAINFLDPEKTFENTVDSLRDFIIALDKEKADHLRYKVEGDVVKIFITPYRTTITDADLDFSQGDYNVELVLALGVKRQDNIDKALASHGQIFDDATVATIVAGKEKSDLGTVSWRDENASSLSEMMVSLGDALKIDKGFIDEQIATAFMAGIVAATDRFSNNQTSARVMTIAAELMGAGANQQLIASKFDEAADEDGEVQGIPATTEVPVQAPKVGPAVDDVPTENNDGTTNLAEGESSKVERSDDVTEVETPAPQAPPTESGAGTLNVPHEKEGTIDEVAQQKAMEDQAEAAEAAVAAASAAVPASTPEEDLAAMLPPVMAPGAIDTPIVETSANDLAVASAAATALAETPQLQPAVSSDIWQSTPEPTYGGTLNATTEAAAEDARKFESDDRNRTILSHSGGYIADQTPIFEAPPLNAAAKGPEDQPIVNPLSEVSSPTLTAAPLQPISPTLSQLDEQARAPAMPSLPPLPDFSTLPPLPPLPPVPSPANISGTVAAEPLGNILPPVEQAASAAPAVDPGQFKIPGQS